MASILSYKDLTRTLQGAYKDLDIPYLTLLNLTLLNSTSLNLSEVSKETTEKSESITKEIVITEKVEENF
jgi:hypothetical protein